MMVHTFGDPKQPVLLLLHGGGFPWWAYESAAQFLQEDYYVVLPVLDGCGEAAQQPFLGIHEAALALLDWVDAQLGGRVFALGGCALGAQIALEALTERPKVAKYAILEGVLVTPVRGTERVLAPCSGLFHDLLRFRGFARFWAGLSGIPGEWQERYREELRKISRRSLKQMVLSGGSYALRPSSRYVEACMLVLVGEKVPKRWKHSAQRLHQTLPQSTLYPLAGMRHGEFCLRNPQEYANFLIGFFIQHGD